MEGLKLGTDRNNYLEISSQINGDLCFEVGYYMQYAVNKEEARQIVEHLTKVFEL